MYVLDTNTLIYFFKGMGQVAEKLWQQPPQDIAIPAVVLFELEVGIAKSNAPAKRRQQLGQLADAVMILPFDQAAARAAADIRVILEALGQPIGPYDLLIAAVAQANQATLVTHNTKEFGRIPDLSVVDWYA